MKTAFLYYKKNIHCLPSSPLEAMSSDPKYDDLHKQLFDEGLKMRRSVVGSDYVDKALENGSTEVFARRKSTHQILCRVRY